MAWRYSKQRLVDMCHMRLKTVYLLEVRLDALKLQFFLHVGDCSEVRAIGEMLAFFGTQVNSVHDMVIIHRGQTSNDVRNQAFAQDIKPMLFVHLNDAQVPVALSEE